MNTQILSPLEQFELRNLISLDAPILFNLHLSLTNIGLYLTLASIIVVGMNVLATNNNKVVSNN
jgi:F-type H+-transporting ATPase subunit a